MSKVSVVIPAYNQARYLHEALSSVLAQTHTDFEIVVVDDGSGDDTAAVCAAFGDPRIRYIHQANDRTLGIGARNHAMLEARGEWIALLDQDDRWAPDKLARQLALAAQMPQAGTLFCRVRFIDGTGQVTGVQDNELPQGDVFHSLLRGNPYHSPSGMFRRSLLRVVGLPHAWVGLGDHALWLLLARRAPVAVVNEVLADYRVHAQGYQAAQRREGLLRLADDSARMAMLQAGLLHPGCAACRHAQSRTKRAVAGHYVNAARAALRQARFLDAARAWRQAFAASPTWCLTPWIAMRLLLRAVVDSLRGLRAAWRARAG